MKKSENAILKSTSLNIQTLTPGTASIRTGLSFVVPSTKQKMYCHYCDYSVSKALSTVVSSLYLSLCLCKIASSFYLGTPILYIYYNTYMEIVQVYNNAHHIVYIPER